MNNLPIGIFDSGFGGLTVAKAIHDKLPQESIIYLGDTARCDEDVLSYIAFPQLAEKFFEERKAREENIVTYTIEEA